MKKQWIRILTLALCAALLFGAFPMTAAATDALSDYEIQVVQLTNRERYNAGKQPLTILSGLTNACDIRAAELPEAFSHTRPDGTSCFTVLDEVGVSWNYCAENIAGGYQSPEEVVEGWMNSEGHRQNILGENYAFTHMGAGYYYRYVASYGYSDWWEQLFTGKSACSYSGMTFQFPEGSEFSVGTSIDDMGILAYMTCSACGESILPLISEYCSGFDDQKAGEQTVTVSCLGLTGTFTVTLKDGTEPTEPEVTSVPMYRVYNPYTYEHLLTTDSEEVNSLCTVGWTLDGIAWQAATSGTPVYRLYNPYDDFHFYTMSQSEINSLTALGWKVDGVATYSAEDDGIPIYRLFNPYAKTCYHLFTASQSEIDVLLPLGWIHEGTAWYAVS